MSTPNPHPPHSRKDRPKVTKGHKWSFEERMTLHILFHEFDLADEDLQEIFHAANPHLRQRGYNYVYMHLRDDWRQRFANGKSKMWRVIDQNSYTAQEFAEIATLRASIVTAAGTLGLPLTVSAELGSQSLHAPPGLALQPAAASMPNANQMLAAPAPATQTASTPISMTAPIAHASVAPAANLMQARAPQFSPARIPAQTANTNLPPSATVAAAPASASSIPPPTSQAASVRSSPPISANTANQDMRSRNWSSSPLPTAGLPYPAYGTERQSFVAGWNPLTDRFSDENSDDIQTRLPALTNMNALTHPTSSLGLLQYDLMRYSTFYESDDEDIVAGPANYQRYRTTAAAPVQRIQPAAPMATGQQQLAASRQLQISASTGRATVVSSNGTSQATSTAEAPTSNFASRTQQLPLRGDGRSTTRLGSAPVPDETQPHRLSMLHYQSVGVRDSGPPHKKYWSMNYLKFHDDSELYKRGGEVINVYFRDTGRNEDIMVCDTSVCKVCNAKGAIIPPIGSNGTSGGGAPPRAPYTWPPPPNSTGEQQQGPASGHGPRSKPGPYIPGSNDPPLRKLNMLHFMSVSLSPTEPPGKKIWSHPHLKFQYDSPIYLHGGQVMRVFFPTTGLHEDIMICDTTICSHCNSLATMPENPSKNLPLVHLERDIVHDEQTGDFVFQPKEQVQNPVGSLGGRKSLAITFLGEDGKNVTAYANHCEIQHCEICREVVMERMRREEEQSVGNGERMELD